MTDVDLFIALIDVRAVLVIPVTARRHVTVAFQAGARVCRFRIRAYGVGRARIR